MGWTRWAGVVVGLVVFGAAACTASTSDAGGAGASVGSVPLEPVGSTTGGNRPSQPTTTVEGSTPTAVDLQLEPAAHDCGVSPGRTDLGDIRTDSQVGGGDQVSSDEVDPFADEPGIVLPPGASASHVGGPWFQVGTTAFVRVDPATVAVESSLVVPPACHIWSASASDDGIAATLCATTRGASPDPGPCSLTVVSDVGSPIGRWAVDGYEVDDITWADGRVVLAGAADAFAPGFVVVDPSSGAGTIVGSVDGCPTGTGKAGLVAGTTMVRADCLGGRSANVVVDARTGSIVRRDGLEPVPYDRDGDAVVAGFGGPRFDPDTFAELGPTETPRAVLDAAEQNPVGDLLRARSTSTGAWLQRCVGPCVGATDEVELTFVDLSGATVATWSLDAAPMTRNASFPSVTAIAAIDDDGAWAVSGGRLVRLDPVR